MKYICLMALLWVPMTALGQSYESLRALPGARETTVTSRSAYIYERPDLTSDVVGRYSQGREVLAYEMRGDFYAVATPSAGHVGFILLTALDVPQVPGAAVAPVVDRDRKDPDIAQVLGYAFPGGGHFYAGETARGAGLLAASMGSFAVGFALSERTRTYTCVEGAVQCDVDIDRTMLLAGTGVALAAWLVGVLDADNAARRTNARNGVTADLRPVPVSTDAATRLGLALRLRW